MENKNAIELGMEFPIIASIIAFASEHAPWMVAVATLGTILWGAIRYISIRSEEARQRKFENYHSLIKELVERENLGEPKRLDRQIAIIFELRNFRSYFPVTLRILRGLREDWADFGSARLITEINLSIAYIEKKQNSLFSPKSG